MSVRMQIYLSRDQYDKLKEKSRLTGKPIAEYIRESLGKCLEEDDRGEALLKSKGLTIVAVNEALLRKSQELFKNHEDKGFSFTDCTSFMIMKAHNLHRVFAFDHHFSQMGFTVNKSMDP